MTTRIEDKVEHRQKITPAFIKNFDEEQGILTGYASVGGFADSYGDIVDPGAFKKTLKIAEVPEGDLRTVLREQDQRHRPGARCQDVAQGWCPGRNEHWFRHIRKGRIPG